MNVNEKAPLTRKYYKDMHFDVTQQSATAKNLYYK